MEEPKQELLDEVDALEAILMDDVIITRNSQSNFPEIIETTVFPTTGDDVESQYVCITLQIMPGPGYPDAKPDFKLKGPRGLDDAGINAIHKAIAQKLDDSVGQAVVFDLIDLIRELLNDSNLPSGQCVICLYGFQDGDAFTKTACYHYFHNHCLAIWLSNAKLNYDEEVAKLPNWQRSEAKPFQSSCPVCRELIDVQEEKLSEAQPPLEQASAPQFTLTDELKTLQAQMAKLFQHQKERGGIIDATAEDKASLIAIDPEGAANEQKRRQEPRVVANPQANTSAPQKPKKQSQEEEQEGDSSDDDRKKRQGGRRQDRYHKGKRERYHDRYRNQDAAAR